MDGARRVSGHHDGNPQGGRWARRAAWAVVVTVFFAGLGVTLQTASHERQEGATMTGGDLVSGSPLSKTIAELEAKVAADGQDIDALNQLSYIAINAGDLGAAMGWLDKARAVAPEHPEVAPTWRSFRPRWAWVCARRRSWTPFWLKLPRSVRRCCGRG